MDSIDPYNLLRIRTGNEIGGYFKGLHQCSSRTADDIKTDLTITTAEGDQVTLKSNIGNHTTFNTRENWVKKEARNSLTIYIEGDLNEAELKDINKAIDDIDKAMRKIIDENLGETLSTGDIDIANLETIKSFSGNLQKITLPDKQLSEEELQKSFKNQREAYREHLSRLENNLVESVNKTSVQPDKLVKPINRLFVALFAEGRNHSLLNDSQLDFIKEIHADLLKKLSPEEADALPNIVNEAL